MIKTSLLALAVALSAAPLGAAQLYRWVDETGRVEWRDTAPPPDAKNVEQRNVGTNTIQTSILPYSVQQAMNEVHDEKLSQLVSLGGWLRGTEVLTSVVNERFSADGAELLHQPDLLAYFQKRLQGMPEFDLPIIHQIQDALVEVKPLIDVGDRRIPPETVKKVNEITTRLGQGIVTKN